MQTKDVKANAEHSVSEDEGFGPGRERERTTK